jgi:hypothetical protein
MCLSFTNKKIPSKNYIVFCIESKKKILYSPLEEFSAQKTGSCSSSHYLNTSVPPRHHDETHHDETEELKQKEKGQAEDPKGRG